MKMFVRFVFLVCSPSQMSWIHTGFMAFAARMCDQIFIVRLFSMHHSAHEDVSMDDLPINVDCAFVFLIPMVPKGPDQAVISGITGMVGNPFEAVSVADASDKRITMLLPSAVMRWAESFRVALFVTAFYRTLSPDIGSAFTISLPAFDASIGHYIPNSRMPKAAKSARLVRLQSKGFRFFPRQTVMGRI